MTFDIEKLTGRTPTPEEMEKAISTNILQMQIKADNEAQGYKKYYDCPKCKNKGRYFIEKNGVELAVDCECMPLRDSIEALEKSGLSSALKKMTFDNYTCGSKWQAQIKETAMSFLTAPEGYFFFIGGQSGAGKTHICTALLKGFWDNKKSIRYFKWADDLNKVLSLSSSESRAERAGIIEPLKKTDVIYIDDFLRSKMPSQAEIKLAFEIINARYTQDLTTIISSEKTAGEIKTIDEAIFSRIIERTNKGEYCINLPRNPDINQRLN